MYTYHERSPSEDKSLRREHKRSMVRRNNLHNIQYLQPLYNPRRRLILLPRRLPPQRKEVVTPPSDNPPVVRQRRGMLLPRGDLHNAYGIRAQERVEDRPAGAVLAVGVCMELGPKA